MTSLNPDEELQTDMYNIRYFPVSSSNASTELNHSIFSSYDSVYLLNNIAMLCSIFQCFVTKLFLFVYLFVFFVCQVNKVCYNLTNNKPSQSLKNGKFYFSVSCHHTGFSIVCLNVFLLDESPRIMKHASIWHHLCL